MVGGQVVDIESEGKENVDSETVQWIHGRKTGALLTASLVGGALLVGANAEQEQALAEYGENIGLAFQITDDLLDIYGDSQKIGKPIGSDIKHDKATYPKIFGRDNSIRLVGEAYDRAVRAITLFGEKSIPLVELAKYIVSRDD
jgi:geranylgeranyl diphosphate synthase type II